MPMLAITAIANFFGISVFRLAIYAAIGATIIIGALTIRQHYINLGWQKHAEKVERQDNKAVTASKAVQQKADDCEANSFWDVVTKSCKTGD